MLKSKALGLTLGIFLAVCAGGMMVISLLTGWGKEMLETFGPYHPWFQYTWLGALWMAVLHFVVGFVDGWLFAWVYNKLAK